VPPVLSPDGPAFAGQAITGTAPSPGEDPNVREERSPPLPEGMQTAPRPGGVCVCVCVYV
jgi:hypothetical protein